MRLVAIGEVTGLEEEATGKERRVDLILCTEWGELRNSCFAKVEYWEASAAFTGKADLVRDTQTDFEKERGTGTQIQARPATKKRATRS